MILSVNNVHHDLYTDMIKQGADLGIDIPESAIPAFIFFTEQLLEWNKSVNLTAITEPEEIITKHYIDSLTVMKHIEHGTAVMDLGTGAGFPGIPLKILRPDIKLTLVDGVGKRFLFINAVLKGLGIGDVNCIHARAEDLARKAEYRSAYDVVVARAVARLDKLSGYALPLVADGGIFLAMKGPSADQEVVEAEKKIKALKATVENIETVHLKGDIIHKTVIIKKSVPS